MIPLLAFGANNGHEVLFIGCKTRTPSNQDSRDIVWVPAPFEVVDGYAVYGWSNAARINMQLLNRLLTVRSEWSKK